MISQIKNQIIEIVLIKCLTFDALIYEQIIKIQIKIMISQIKNQMIETMLISSLTFDSLSYEQII